MTLQPIQLYLKNLKQQDLVEICDSIQTQQNTDTVCVPARIHS